MSNSRSLQAGLLIFGHAANSAKKAHADSAILAASSTREQVRAV